MYGFDCAGVEIDKKAFDAYAVFIERWAKDKRLKHQFQRGKVKGYPKLRPPARAPTRTLTGPAMLFR